MSISLDLDKINTALELKDDAEIKDFLRTVNDKELIIFDYPLHVKYDDWLFCIGSNVCISLQDEEDDDLCYVYAMLPEDSDKHDEFYKIKKNSSNNFEIISGSGLGGG